jgi:glycerol-3-phosphate dehydrogenase
MEDKVDVLVVGGGVHGAGVAQRAAAAGHSVRVLEKSTIAAGTSSRSSKLIHGGLRYLETGQIRLVRESLHERTALLRLAPELVRLQRFHMPVYAQTRRRPWQLRTGLSMYAVLSSMGPGSSFGTLPRSRWDSLDGLNTRGLQKVFWYHDGQTDDAALTRAVLASAGRLGGEVVEHAEFIGAELTPAGVVARYAHAGVEKECAARVLVNAAGPWAVDVARRISPAIVIPAVDLVQGTHLLLDHSLTQGIYYVESPRDGRAIFVMPWKGRMLVGTTETRFRAAPETVAPTMGEKHYLLQVLRHYFPAFRAMPIDAIAGSFAGLRVLPAGKGHAFHRSRETHFECDRETSPRVVSIYGGKFTTFRATAKHALARVAASLPTRSQVADVDRIPLTPV